MTEAVLIEETYEAPTSATTPERRAFQKPAGKSSSASVLFAEMHEEIVAASKAARERRERIGMIWSHQPQPLAPETASFTEENPKR